MKFCTNCGSENADNMQFCVKCGSQLAPAPQPESWRTPSGGLGNQQTVVNDPYAPGYIPPPPSTPPSYNPPQQMQYTPQQAGGASQMHPAIPALVSFFFPGIGLLFVPNKAGLGIGIFAGFIALNVILFILAFITFGLGTCLFLLVPLVNIAAAIHSYDEAAKVSNGQYSPILFK